MKLSRNAVAELYNGLNTLGGLQGVKFTYFVAKNKALLESEIKDMKEVIKTSEEYNVYEKARIALAEEHAVKEDGKPVVKDNRYVMEDKEAFNKACEALKLEHKDAIDQRKKQVEDFNKFLEEEIELNLHNIQLTDVPTNITVEQMEIIEPLVKDTPSEE